MLTSKRWVPLWLGRRYGAAFSLDAPAVGPTVVISDPVLIKEVFTWPADVFRRPATLGFSAMIGPGATFSLEGAALRARRKLLFPPFHGKRLHGYEEFIEQQVLREIARWPEDREFATLPSMLRITLNTTLRAVIGTRRSAAFDELRQLFLPLVLTGSRLAVLPAPARRDFGPWSLRAKHANLRRRANELVAQLIAETRADPDFAHRDDVLALLLQARYDDGSPISDNHVTNELLGLVAVGHETTATTLAWTVERVRRHPALLARLTDEADAHGGKLRQATIWEVQRTRPVVIGTRRRTNTRLRLGEWVIPADTIISVNIELAHSSEANYPNAKAFDPDRFIDNPPDNYSWVPFGGGGYRCIGATFANFEMNVVLRTLLREFHFAPTHARGERRHSRGMAYAPARGGLAVVHRRRPAALVPASTSRNAETRSA